MINIEDKYVTRNGKRVINLKRVPRAGTGPATFPIKGSIVFSEKPRKSTYCIWTDDGKFGCIPEHDNHKFDLIKKESTDDR